MNFKSEADRLRYEAAEKAYLAKVSNYLVFPLEGGATGKDLHTPTWKLWLRPIVATIHIPFAAIGYGVSINTLTHESMFAMLAGIILAVVSTYYLLKR